MSAIINQPYLLEENDPHYGEVECPDGEVYEGPLVKKEDFREALEDVGGRITGIREVKKLKFKKGGEKSISDECIMTSSKIHAISFDKELGFIFNREMEISEVRERLDSLGEKLRERVPEDLDVAFKVFVTYTDPNRAGERLPVRPKDPCLSSSIK